MTATAAAAASEGDSDDDGFFEQSSLGDSDASRVDDSSLATPSALTTLDNSVTFDESNHTHAMHALKDIALKTTSL